MVSSSIGPAFDQEMRFLLQPTAVMTTMFGTIGYGASFIVPIKEGAGLVCGLSGSLIATVVAPIFNYISTESSTGPIENLNASFAFLVAGGLLSTEILLGIGIDTIALLSLTSTLEVLIVAFLAKIVARIAYQALYASLC